MKNAQDCGDYSLMKNSDANQRNHTHENVQTEVCALKERNTIFWVPKTKDPGLWDSLRTEKSFWRSLEKDLSELAKQIGSVLENILGTEKQRAVHHITPFLSPVDHIYHGGTWRLYHLGTLQPSKFMPVHPVMFTQSGNGITRHIWEHIHVAQQHIFVCLGPLC